MKKFIDRIRNTDPRRAAINTVLFALFGVANWTAVKLIGVIVNANQYNHKPSDGVPAAYMLGVLTFALLADTLRRMEKALTGRFIRKTAEVAE